MQYYGYFLYAFNNDIFNLSLEKNIADKRPETKAVWKNACLLYMYIIACLDEILDTASLVSVITVCVYISENHIKRHVNFKVFQLDYEWNWLIFLEPTLWV